MVVLKPEPEMRGLKPSPRGLADVVYQKTMFGRYYCRFENFGKTLRKIHFYITTMANKSMKDS